MSNPDSRSSAARRGPSGGQPSMLLMIIGGVLAFIAILVVFRPGREPEPVSVPEPGAAEPTVAASARASSPTPAAAMPSPVESPTPTATPTPAAAAESCVALSWHAELRQGDHCLAVSRHEGR